MVSSYLPASVSHSLTVPSGFDLLSTRSGENHSPMQMTENKPQYWLLSLPQSYPTVPNRNPRLLQRTLETLESKPDARISSPMIPLTLLPYPEYSTKMSIGIVAKPSE